MTLRDLQVFQTVCQQEGFTKAAARLYMTQPAVSHTIRELERQLGAPLFERLSKKIYLTEAGRELQKKAQHLLELYQDLETNGITMEQHIPLRIGSTITIANFWLPQILQDFHSRSTAYKETVTVENASTITEKLLDNQIDVGLIEGPISSQALVHDSFSSYSLVPVCAPGHPACREESLTPEKLLNHNLLLREPGSAIRDTLDSALRLCGLSASPGWESVNSQALIQAALAGLGIAVLPAPLVRPHLSANALVPLPILGLTLTNQNHLVYHKDKYLSPSLSLFIEILKNRK